MAYTKEAKPKMVDYLQREQGDYILLEHGGKIIIRRAWNADGKPTASYSRDAKPTATYTKEVKPAVTYSKEAKPTGAWSKEAKPAIP